MHLNKKKIVFTFVFICLALAISFALSYPTFQKIKQVHTLETTIHELQLDKVNKEKELKQLEEKLEFVNADIKILTDAKNTLSALQSERENYQNDINNLKKEISSLESKIKTQEQNNANLKKQIK